MAELDAAGFGEILSFPPDAEIISGHMDLGTQNTFF